MQYKPITCDYKQSVNDALRSFTCVLKKNNNDRTVSDIIN